MKELKLDLTMNFDLHVEVDRDADNWVKIEGFELENFAPQWWYEVRDQNGSVILLELSNGNGIEVDVVERSVKLTIDAELLKSGTYYHLLYADSEDADKKFRFGGSNNLIVKKY